MFGSFLGFLVFGEVPGIMVIIGSAIVLLGVYLFSVDTAPDAGKDGPSEL